MPPTVKIMATGLLGTRVAHGIVELTIMFYALLKTKRDGSGTDRLTFSDWYDIVEQVAVVDVFAAHHNFEVTHTHDQDKGLRKYLRPCPLSL